MAPDAVVGLGLHHRRVEDAGVDALEPLVEPGEQGHLEEIALVHQAFDDGVNVEWEFGVGWDQLVHGRVRAHVEVG